MSHAAVHPGGKQFEWVVNAAICVNVAVMVWPRVTDSYVEVAERFDDWFLMFFGAELLVRFVAAGCNPRRFLRVSRWNGFDFLVISLALSPLIAHMLPHLVTLLGVHLTLQLGPGVNSSLLRMLRLAAPVARFFHGLRHLNHLRTLTVLRLARIARAARLLHGLRQMVHLRVARRETSTCLR